MQLHKLVYEVLMRQAWSVFRAWITEKHGKQTCLVNNMFFSLQTLRDNVCETEFQEKLCKISFSQVTELF